MSSPGGSRRPLFRVLLGCVAALAAAVVLLYALQDLILYHPRRYAAGYVEGLPPDIVRLAYHITAMGRDIPQMSYYVPPAGAQDRPPGRLMVLFGGNGSLALDWLNEIRRFRDDGIGFLLVEYPGYGRCEGQPSPDSLLAGSEAAFAALAGRLHVPAKALERNVGTMGHSLGCAASLQFAVRHPVNTVILIAPFTSTMDLARHRVGWPLSLLLRDRFDNMARVRELISRPGRPAIIIAHGARDRTIPPSHGFRLASISGSIDYHEFSGANHETVIQAAREQISRGVRYPHARPPTSLAAPKRK